MHRRPLLQMLILSAAILVTAGCGTGGAMRGSPGHVLIVHADARSADAEALAGRLRERGFEVALEVEGPAVRTRSSAAVYTAARRPERVEAVESALPPLEVELLPFVQGGPRGTDTVIWLVAQ